MRTPSNPVEAKRFELYRTYSMKARKSYILEANALPRIKAGTFDIIELASKWTTDYRDMTTKLTLH